MENKKKGVVQPTAVTAINMMGSGIIMLPTNLAQVGTMSILSWLLTAFGTIFIAYGFFQAGMFTRKVVVWAVLLNILTVKPAHL